MTGGPRTAGELAAMVRGTLEGCATAPVRGLNAIDQAGPDEATFVVDARYAAKWAASRAGVALVARGVACDVGDPSRRALIRVEHAELALAAALEAFAPPTEVPATGVHAAADVDPSASVGSGVAVGAGATIGRGARVGEGCVLHPGSHVVQPSSWALAACCTPAR